MHWCLIHTSICHQHNIPSIQISYTYIDMPPTRHPVNTDILSIHQYATHTTSRQYTDVLSIHRYATHTTFPSILWCSIHILEFCSCPVIPSMHWYLIHDLYSIATATPISHLFTSILSPCRQFRYSTVIPPIHKYPAHIPISYPHTDIPPIHRYTTTSYSILP